MKRWIIAIFSFMMFSSFIGFASQTQFFNYAYISGTDSIAFNAQIDGNIYKVSIDWSNVFLVTGSDGLKYHCWKVIGTGATEKLGQVFFTYWSNLYNDWVNSYICNDGKRRGKAKIEGGGWIEFNDSGFSGPVLDNFFTETNYFYHSADGNGNGTGYGFTDGIGLWIWNLVKADYNPRTEIFKYIDPNKSILKIETFHQDLQTKGRFSLTFYDNISYAPINGLNFNLKFISGGNYFLHNGKSSLLFLNLSDYIKNLKAQTNIYTGYLIGYKCGSGDVMLQVYWGTGKVLLTTGIYLSCPFDLNFYVSDGDGDGKIYIGGNEKGSLSISNITNITNLIFTNLHVDFDSKYSYDFDQGGDLLGLGNFNIRVYPVTSYVDNILPVFYVGEGSYNISSGSLSFSNISFNYVKSNKVNFEADKKIVNITDVKKCPGIKGNGQSVCNLGLRFINKFDYSVVGLGVSNFSAEDTNKSLTLSEPYKTFDINETDAVYTNGLVIDSYSSSLSDSGYFYLNIISYKPVVNAALDLDFNFSDGQNIGYMLSGINLAKAMDLRFSGLNLDNGVAIGIDNKVEIVYEKLSSNILAGEFYLSGKLIGCSDCEFLSGGIITGQIGISENVFTKQITIYISGVDIPDQITYFDKYYTYTVNGVNGSKIVKLKPNIVLNGSDLIIDGQVFGFLQFGIALGKSIWVYRTDRVVFIGEGVPLLNNVFSIIKEFNKTYKGEKFLSASRRTGDSFNNLNRYRGLFKCNGNETLQLGNGLDITLTNYNEIVLWNCDILIKSNILKNNQNDKLIIKVVKQPYKFIDFWSYDGWKSTSNIYIASNVDTIMADFITNGSILFLSGSQPDQENIFFPNRRLQPSLKRQIYIKGKIRSVNTIGGGFALSGKVMLPGGKIENKDIKGFFGNINLTAADVARGYDINFARASIVDFGQSKYDTGLVSTIILNKYNCIGNKNIDPQPCWMPVVIEYDE